MHVPSRRLKTFGSSEQPFEFSQFLKGTILPSWKGGVETIGIPRPMFRNTKPDVLVFFRPPLRRRSVFKHTNTLFSKQKKHRRRQPKDLWFEQFWKTSLSPIPI